MLKDSLSSTGTKQVSISASPTHAHINEEGQQLISVLPSPLCWSKQIRRQTQEPQFLQDPCRHSAAINMQQAVTPKTACYVSTTACTHTAFLHHMLEYHNSVLPDPSIFTRSGTLRTHCWHNASLLNSRRKSRFDPKPIAITSETNTHPNHSGNISAWNILSYKDTALLF